jgi:ribulose-phosphate 3-epimerase
MKWPDMPVICPTVTAYDTHAYREQMERIEPFAERIHIDLMDGQFAPTKSPPLNQIWLPDNITSDIHLMYQHPMNYLDQLIKLKPNLVIIQYEADVDHAHFATHLRENGIKAGLALLQETKVDSITDLMPCFDHVLIFSGDLGHHGGTADLKLLDKVKEVKIKFPEVEISWDGGINDQNAKQLVEAGVDVLNVGGFIQNADDPQEAYATLKSVI